MTNQPGEKQTNSDGVKDISVSDGDHHVDGFEQIGFLALRILSSIKARKKTEGANNAAPSVSFAQASLGGSLASNKTENGGTDSFVPADSLLAVKRYNLLPHAIATGSHAATSAAMSFLQE